MSSIENPDNTPSDDRSNQHSPQDLALANLFEGSPGKMPISHLQRSYRHLCNKEGRAQQLPRHDMEELATLEEKFRSAVSQDVQQGSVFGYSSIDQILIHDGMKITRVQPGKPPVLSFAAELRDNDGNNFAMSSSGIHQVSGLSYHRISSFVGLEEDFQYEVLMSKETFDNERIEFERQLESGKHLVGEVDELFLGGFIADEILYMTDIEDFSFSDVLAVEYHEGNDLNGYVYELFLTDSTQIAVHLRYSRKNSMPIVDVAIIE